MHHRNENHSQIMQKWNWRRVHLFVSSFFFKIRIIALQISLKTLTNSAEEKLIRLFWGLFCKSTIIFSENLYQIVVKWILREAHSFIPNLIFKIWIILIEISLKSLQNETYDKLIQLSWSLFFENQIMLMEISIKSLRDETYKKFIHVTCTSFFKFELFQCKFL